MVLPTLTGPLPSLYTFQFVPLSRDISQFHCYSTALPSPLPLTIETTSCSQEDIDLYVASGESFGKAGAYGVLPGIPFAAERTMQDNLTGVW